MSSIEDTIKSRYERARRASLPGTENLSAVSSRGRQLRSRSRRRRIVGTLTVVLSTLAVVAGFASLGRTPGLAKVRVAPPVAAATEPTRVANQPTASEVYITGRGLAYRTADDQIRLCTAPTFKMPGDSCSGPTLRLSSQAVVEANALFHDAPTPYVQLEGTSTTNGMTVTSMKSSVPPTAYDPPRPADCVATGSATPTASEASGFLSEAETTYPDTFGGGWVTSDGVLVASFVGGAPRDFVHPGFKFCTTNVGATLSSLQQVAQQIASDEPGLAPRQIEIRGVGVDQSRNAVAVQIDVLLTASKAELEARYGTHLEFNAAISQSG
jgi:hypothetical protein